MISTLLTLFVIGIVGLVAISVVMALFGIVFGVAGFLLFKVAPVLLLGWVILKLIQRTQDRRRVSASDQRWLDS